MSDKLSPELTEMVYSLMLKNPGIFKYDLYHEVHTHLNITVTHTMLDDVLFYLRQRRGIFSMRGYGYYGDEST